MSALMEGVSVRVICGDCCEVMRGMAAASVDAIVTDPPYELGFMGKGWDKSGVAYCSDVWGEALRILKPGGHLLAFGGSRTYHRLSSAIEDAGFEIRDQIIDYHDSTRNDRAFLDSLSEEQRRALAAVVDDRSPLGQVFWNYGVGFPKGLNAVTQLVKLALWQSSDRAPLVVQSSRCIRVRSSKEKAPIAAALVQTLPGGGLGLLTATGEGVALHVPTDTWPSEWMATIGLSTTWLWSGCLDDASKEASKCITETASETIIDLETWRWLAGLHTSANTTLASVTLPNGEWWPAVHAGNHSSDGLRSLKLIPIVTALGPATLNPVVKFQGFNVALKPSHEPLVLARKPLAAGTVAANVLEHGTGALNIDGCRVPGAIPTTIRGGHPEKHRVNDSHPDAKNLGRLKPQGLVEGNALGRWPANVIHDGSEEVEAAFAAFGESKSPDGPVRQGGYNTNGFNVGGGRGRPRTGFGIGFGDTGTASRFFYCSKAGRNERWKHVVCRCSAQVIPPTHGVYKLKHCPVCGDEFRVTAHPTQKPESLMRYLVRLITPPGGTVLDIFAGSGSTGCAALAEGFGFVGIEADVTYAAIAEARIAAALVGPKDGAKAKVPPVSSPDLFSVLAAE